MRDEFDSESIEGDDVCVVTPQNGLFDIAEKIIHAIKAGKLKAVDVEVAGAPEPMSLLAVDGVDLQGNAMDYYSVSVFLTNIFTFYLNENNVDAALVDRCFHVQVIPLDDGRQRLCFSRFDDKDHPIANIGIDCDELLKSCNNLKTLLYEDIAPPVKFPDLDGRIVLGPFDVEESNFFNGFLQMMAEHVHGVGNGMAFLEKEASLKMSELSKDDVYAVLNRYAYLSLFKGEAFSPEMQAQEGWDKSLDVTSIYIMPGGTA